MSVDMDMPGHSPSCADVHDLTAGFAFGALDSNEQHLLEQHCAGCPSCAASLHQARQTAVMLSFAVRPLAPPPVAKAELFARIAQQGQATTTPLAALSSVQSARAENAGSPKSATSVTQQDRQQSSTSSQIQAVTGRFHFPIPARFRRGESDRAWSGWSALTVPFATVPLVLALVVVGTIALRSQAQVDGMQQDLADARGKADRLQSTLDTIDSLIADADSRVYFLPPQDSTSQQAYGKVWAKPGASSAVLMVWGLQPTANGSAYQVMLESRTGKMISCGSFRVDRHGNGSYLFSFDQPFTTYESVHVMPMPVNSAAKGSWATTGFLAAPINPIVGQPGDTDLPPTQ